MKFFGLFITILLISNPSNVNCQAYNQWSLGANIGAHDGVHYSGSGIIRITQIHHFDINGRYMFNTKFGVKADLGFDHFKWINLKYPTNYTRISLESVLNLTDIVSFSDFSKKFGALAHVGFGYSIMWNKGASNSNQSNIPLIDRGKVDKMLHGIIGVTPQYKINDKFSVNMDLSMVFHLRQEKTYDFLNKIPSVGGFTGSFLNLTVGGTMYLGERKHHADWYTFPTVVDKDLERINLLENELELLKIKLDDYDGDGVSNFQDDEPNSAPGANVDSRGVTIGNLGGVDSNSKQNSPVPNSSIVKDTTTKVIYLDSNKPDKDGDGVPDEFDICPEIVGTYKGCPDADGDFVPDISDKCPSVKGSVTNNGCPEKPVENKVVNPQLDPEVKNEKQEENKVGIEIKETLLSEVFFEIGSSALNPKAMSQLDLLIKLLGENPKINVNAVGVADQTGSQTANEKLSLKRVNECVDYMVKKGISRERFIVSYKVAINTNNTNKLLFGAMNRKVTFTVKK